MIYLYLFSLLWSLSAWALISFRTDEKLLWNLIDSAVFAGVLTTMLAEYQWWVGLGRNILEYINA
ncbi:hypothetical protein [Pseudomonas phage LKA1]|uniref:Uncharacterized protein n=1 Tax=Pseudomonas phage LKA1 TaxID=386793 RepID=Q0E606_9CAUD|nr:hypothetical protein AV952_gp08 [Pseudomonas phage LKA1]CAK24976.1 hypothetical protein [Pseudomonas phage LKA1]